MWSNDEIQRHVKWFVDIHNILKESCETYFGEASNEIDMPTMIKRLCATDDFEDVFVLAFQLFHKYDTNFLEMCNRAMDGLLIPYYLFGGDIIEISYRDSIPLLLSSLFGTEEYVNARREIAILRDKVTNQITEQPCMLSSGSLGEGLAYPPSDDDLLRFKSDIRVVTTNEDISQKGDLLMVLSEYSAGYCLLSDVTKSWLPICIRSSNGKSFVSSTLFKESMRSLPSYETTHIHGPCLMMSLGRIHVDIAPCFACPFWPNSAIEWIERNRLNEWPSLDMIQNIVRSGCHVVPIGDQDSDNCNHEWRISFSLAERTLVHSFNHAQFLTYSLLRYALKTVIDEKVPDVLCSYFMKTTVFYTIERTSSQLWRMDNLEMCYRNCLSMLYEFIDDKNCPNYFIPNYNMIKRKVNDTNKQKLLDLIRHLINKRVIGIVKDLPYFMTAIINESVVLKHMECKLDTQFLKSYHLYTTIDAMKNVNVLSFDVDNSCTLFLRILQYLSKEMETTTGVLKIIMHTGIFDLCKKLMNHLFSSKKHNKQTYILHKTIQSLLLKFAHGGNVTTAKLSTATYMYILGNTKMALLIIKKLLSKYPSYALESTLNLPAVREYTNVMCSRKYTMEYKARRAWAPHFLLSYFDLNAYPMAMKFWISLANNVSLHPITYALLIESLCHLQQQETPLFVKSTTSLLDHLENLKDGHDIACAIMCLGIIRYDQGDEKSAFKWFRSAYLMKYKMSQKHKRTLQLSAITHIALLIQKRRSSSKSNSIKITLFPSDCDLD